MSKLLLSFVRRLWQGFCRFMIDKSKLTADVRNEEYSEKVRFYPYLHEKDESTDWLEVTANSDSPNVNI